MPEISLEFRAHAWLERVWDVSLKKASWNQRIVRDMSEVGTVADSRLSLADSTVGLARPEIPDCQNSEYSLMSYITLT